ncbi:MAG: hypothetical protein CMP75_04240 [Flavobacteriales bacterium]|nr:hypothetical protein [Flavobacteriales bacterium]
MVITKETYHQWMRNPQNLGGKESEELLQLTKEHPYCQSSQLLFLKSLHNEDSIQFNKQLKYAAAFVGDRQQLFYLITEKDKRHQQKPIIKKEETIVVAKKEETKELLRIGQPLQFDTEEKHSFSEWLKLSQAKTIKRKEEASRQDQSLDNKLDLIEQFVAKDRPKTKKEEFFSPINKAKKSVEDQMTFVTETLARVYLEQEHYEKAKLAYQKLSLKYPEKSSFFAGQIELINKLLKDK